MRNIRLLVIMLYMLLMALPQGMWAQLYDDFSDGDFTDNPTWVGTTRLFRVNSSHQLQLYNDEEGTAKLSTPVVLDGYDSLQWECWIKIGFVPTNNNTFKVGLFTYKNAFSDLITVTAQIDKTLLFTGRALDTDVVSSFKLLSSTNALRVRACCVADPRGPFVNFWVDTTLADTPQYFFVGSSGLDTLVFNSLGDVDFAVNCTYTSSRSTSFWFDDIKVYYGTPALPPTAAPILPGEVLISELLFNPHLGGADYLELYNNTDSTLQLSQLSLVSLSSDGSAQRYYHLPDHLLPARQWAVLTTDPQYVLQYFHVQNPDHLLLMPTMPSYNDNSGCVLLENADSIAVDRFDYSSSLHSRLVADPEGVSLERRSYLSSASDDNNWYSAASTTALREGMGWGTPTYKNSQSKELLFLDGDWVVDPTIFSPDGDGYHDLLDISYTLVDDHMSANVTLFDGAGRPVRHLLRGAVLGTHGSFTWDGFDDNGRRCPRGSYILLVEAYSPEGVRQSIKRTVTLIIN